MIIKIIFYVIIFFVIYGYSFYKLGNTIYRIDSEGIKRFSLLPLFTEGFIGPIRSLYILFMNSNIINTLQFLIIILTNTWSPYCVILILLLCNIIM